MSPRERPEPANPPVEKSAAATSADVLRALVAGGIDEGSATTALELTLDSVKIKHGALLTYDGDHQSLSLIAHRNLSPEAQAAMRSIRRGVAGAWDMPLHSLLQRRVYMIERPKENPFVPVLLEGTDQNVLSNLVFLPLYSGGTASGVLLLIGSGARAIREPDIVALREHAKILGAALRESARRAQAAAQAAPAPTVAPPAFDRATLTARIQELEALVESLRKPPPASQPSPEADRRTIELTRERDRLQAELAAREIELVNFKSEASLLRERSSEEGDRARKLAVDLAQTREQLTRISDRERQSGHERERMDRSRSELELRVQGLERRLGKSAEHAKESQAERAALSMRAAEAEAEAGELRKVLTARDAQMTELRAERERLATSLRTAAARAQESEESLAHLREDSAETVSALEARIESAESLALAAERERDQLRAGAAGQSGIVAEIERETQAIRAELAREVERRRAAEETSASVIRDASALRAELERMQGEHGGLESLLADLRGENERLASSLAQARSGREDLGGSLKAAEDRVAALERRFADSERERGELDTETARLQGELASGRAREEELVAKASAADTERNALRGEIEGLRQGLESAREEARAVARERDAVAARAGTLDQKIEALLKEGATVRAERIQREEEAERLRSLVTERESEISRLRSDLDGSHAESVRVREALAAREAAEQAEVARRRELEQHLAELRQGLEKAQAHGSHLTEELESRHRVEEELRRANDALEKELEQQRERLRVDSNERQQLTTRLREMEEVLRGATPDLGAHTADLDALAMLRTTLERSESARRSAEETVERLEGALKGERKATEEARALAESERHAAGELASQIDELDRRRNQAESAAAAAARRADELAAEQAAAAETSRSLATELVRRTAELEDLSERLETRDRELAEGRSNSEQSLERIRSLEDGARAAAAEVASLKRRVTAVQEEREHLEHEHQLRLAEATARAARLAEQLETSSRERDRLLESVGSLEARQQEREEAVRTEAARTAEAQSAIAGSRAQTEKLASEVESLRAQMRGLDTDLRAAKTEVERWQGLNEKLQRSIEERDRDLVGLRGALAAALKKGKPEAAAAAAPAVPPLASPAEPKPGVKKPEPLRRPQPEPPAIPSAVAAPPSRTVVIFDEKGPIADSLTALCRKAGFEPRTLENGAAIAEPPQLIAVNLLSTSPGGFDSIRRSRTESPLKERPIVLYAAKPGSERGVVLPNVECLIRPVAEADFTRAMASLIGTGKRVTIIGEELDSVLKFNGWAGSTGCSVSSAGDLKQGSDLLDIVKPDLIVFDFSRLGGEGAGLIVKVRRSTRLAGLPLLIVLPEQTSPAIGLFLKRLATLAEEAPLDISQLEKRLRPGGAA